MRITRWATVLAATAAILVAPSPAQATELTCRNITETVTNIPLAPGEHHITGTLCAGPANKTIQVLIHGATYSQEYWDFGHQPDKYSYVDAMNRKGVATLNIDRLGTATSSHPASVQVTMPAQVEVVHQLIAALRAGDYGQQFDRVALVGHSLGSIVSFGVANAYPADVDALIPTGMARGIDPAGAVQVMQALLHPAALDGGRFADLDPGYLTTRPGQRGVFYSGSADPAVIAHDETTKETVTSGEFATAISTFLTLGRHPIFTVMGEFDGLFCTIVACSSMLSPWRLERLAFPNARSFESLTVPNTGHDINLHPNGRLFFDAAAEYTLRTLGR